MRNILSSILVLEVISADLPRVITELSDAGVGLRHLRHLDSVAAEMCVLRKDFALFQQVLNSRGAEFRVIRKEGPYWKLQSIWKSPIPVFSALMIAVMTIIFSGQIYFVRVEGNVEIPERYILEKAAKVGIKFGSSRAEIRSEKIKNALLSEIPQLQWVGVNTKGCIATISVREKSVTDEEEAIAGVTGITAIRDGIIHSCTVYKGNALCKVGQAVKKGDLLVSRYTDCGLYTQAERAEAEIYALTERSIRMLTPLMCQIRKNIVDTHTCFGVRIGKNLIKFCNHSGIYDGSCVKMYQEEYWTLPGGFRLPLAWVRETVEIYEATEFVSEDPVEYSWTDSEARKYILAQMIAGRILSDDSGTTVKNDVLIFSGDYSCLEMIGQERYEEILE